MRQKVTMTLMALMITGLGLSAHALAPVIGDVPDVIVGDEASATFPNLFVYPDALDLESWATDDTVTPDQILWSYDFGGTATGRYSFNGVDAIDITGGEDPTVPASFGKRIDNFVAGGELDPDGNTKTVTIRDTTLSPIGGPNTDPGGAGLVNPAGELVTLYASDGTKFNSKEIFVYTDNDGNDRLSGISRENVASVDFKAVTAAQLGWTSSAFNNATVDDGTSGFCLTMGLTGQNLADFNSPYPFAGIDLTANKVYEFRMNLTAEAGIGANETPLLSFTINNGDGISNGANAYGMGGFLLDNEGGANSVGLGTLPNDEFVLYFTPLPVADAEWNSTTGNGPFAAANDAVNDFNIGFRSLDADGTALNAEIDFGKVCLSAIEVDAIDLAAFAVGEQVFSVTEFTNATQGGNTTVNALFGTQLVTTFDENTGTLTIEPRDPNDGFLSDWDLQIVNMIPGTGQVDTGTGAGLPESYPVVWEDDQIYRLSAKFSAPDATAETNPPDVMQLVIDQPTNELNTFSIIAATAFDLAAFPDQNDQTQYQMFWYSHNSSLTTIPNGARFRPRFDIITVPIIQSGGSASNFGGTTIHEWKVEKVTLQGVN